MTDLETRFEQAAESALALSARPDDDTLLRIYALYKQATVGDASGARPGFTDFVARAKFDAWEELQGMDRQAARLAYIELIESLVQS